MPYCYEYPRPMVTVDMVVIEKVLNSSARLLLIKRKNNPYAGKWALPGGFVDMDEPLKDAAVRELLEETYIRVADPVEIGAFGTPGRDPRGRNIAVAFGAVLTSSIYPTGGDDAQDAAMFDINNLPLLAFDHSEIIKKALPILKNRYKSAFK